ncbi:MAG: hypothetical protein JF570_09885, partial [Caulobacter sp.]|nr:hypothetical protein [Caulobacter sp.]
MRGPAFAPGPDPRVEVLRVGRESRPVLVVDGLLTGAEDLVAFAAETAR